MGSLRILLLPFAWLYGLAVTVRNKFYDWGFFRSKEFPFPVICVGNLSAGGTGKTPHVEYLVRLLKKDHRVAALSRGYGRLSSGFILASENSSSAEIGDEPRQYKKKFPDVNVAVDANRVHGILKLKGLDPGIEVIVLDDAFQHRAVKAGLNILLTDYNRLYYKDRLLPAGMLREPVSGAGRADVIIVTKTPGNLTPMEQRILLKEIKPRPHQQVFFSYIIYGEPVSYWNSDEKVSTMVEMSAENFSVVMLTGIANPAPLKDFLSKKFKEVKEMNFPDHHNYSVVDLERLKAAYNGIANEKKVIVTTEKDAMRLDKPGLIEFIKGLPILYLPIEVKFHHSEEKSLDARVKELMKR
ncbi:MAG TPA: tetraacyldisaccharide 4'-kinase [Bacteroidia bacterium]